ncbi:uncharacterized protein TRAVEDRAFT_52809 [Trametes versicolor FP-101664 SS1]|uniref:uncharacterized protein n=1 Tax=Trametes versicolor (strain FP-101664) TaxID=717944 RepID=UPI0004622E15|nr:uncharacterized protein TRAVEDRAFT_52809 [Trametes versicolor FP-101664 SS1]EIW53690.1 hypothetical protein TRAVEDRAFT_52809 [Trametes versicolor FP-101664 SS1]
MCFRPVDDSSGNPPWYAPPFPDGTWNIGGVPERLSSHPEIQKRGMHLSHALKPGTVFVTLVAPAPALLGQHVVKILNTAGEEMAIYERLLRELHRPNNHTLPCEITRTDHPLLIMPRIDDVMEIYRRKWTPQNLMDVIFQVVEGIEFLHSMHIAHLDVHMENLLGGSDWAVPDHNELVENRVYIIDFDTSRQFTLGPGVQTAITLSATVQVPPNGMTRFDPYSWDIYCVGRTLEYIVGVMERRTKVPPHWIAMKYIQWLIGNERGCAGVCRCRPTARTALRVIVVLQWAVYAAEGYRWVAETLARLWTTQN